jgi:hypothetical protein
MAWPFYCKVTFKIDPTSVPILRDLGRLCLQGDLDRAQKTCRALLSQKLGPPLAITSAMAASKTCRWVMGQSAYH